VCEIASLALGTHHKSTENDGWPVGHQVTSLDEDGSSRYQRSEKLVLA
jgi:hypothetical protein